MLGRDEYARAIDLDALYCAIRHVGSITMLCASAFETVWKIYRIQGFAVLNIITVPK